MAGLHVGTENWRRMGIFQRTRALDQGDLGPPYAREVKLCLRGGAGVLDLDCVLASAGDFTGETVQLLYKCRARGDAQAQAVAVGIAAPRFFPAQDRGPVLLRALRRFAAICRSLATFRPPLIACRMYVRVEECHRLQ